MSTKNSDYYFLRGGGEMGELIRAKNWSKTTLGDPAEWPQSLRITLGILLNSKFPMFLWWGNELNCYYNDAYRPSLGKDGKHPSILGMPAKEAWTEIWETIKPLIDKVVNARESVWFEDMLVPIYRNGEIEDVYWTFSYSPVIDDTGNIAGVLVTCTETTEKVCALRKIEESNQRFRNTMKQAPVGITILLGAQYIVEMANDAYLQLVDKKESEFVGKPLFESLPEVQQSVHSLLDGVFNTGVPYHGNEVPIPLNRYGRQGVYYFDFLYHPLRDDDGNVSGIIVTVTEVTEKVEERKTVEERKRLYETVTQNTPDLVYVFDLNYRFTYANEALLNMWGRTWDNAIGKSLLEIGYERWHAEMHEGEIDQVIATKKPVRGEVSFPHATLGNRIYDYILVPVIDKDGNVEAISGITRDITQQVEAHKQIEESEMRFRNMVEQAPVAICVLRGGNYVVEVANQMQLKLWGKTKEQVLNLPIFTAIPEGRGQGFEELLDGVFTTGKAFIATEMPTTLTRNGHKETFYSNFTYEPLYNSENKIVGIISIVSDVTEQVVARKNIEESDQKLRSLIENAPFPIGVYAGKEMRIELANASIIKAWGKGNDVKGKLFKEIVPEVESQQIFEQLDAVFTSGIPFHAYNRYLKLIIDGKEQPYYYNYSFTPVFDLSGNVNGVMNTASDVTELNLAKKRIEESEQDLRSMALRSPIGICILDATTLVCEIVNDSFIEIVGKPREAIAGKYYWDTFAEARPYYESALNKIIREGTPFFANEKEFIVMRHGKEEKKYVTFVYAPLNNEEGNVKKVAVWLLDNTQQVIARRKIEEDAEKLNIVIDASELGTWELNLTTKEPTYSKRYLEILGGYKEEIKLNHSQLLQHLHPDDLPIREKAFKEALATGYLHYQARLIWNDDSIHWMEGKGKVFYDEDGKPVKLVGTIRDITEAKNYEEELKRSEEQFKVLANQAPMWVWLTDKKVNIIYTNPEVLKFLGIAHYTEFTGNMWEQKVHPEDIALVYKSFGDAVSLQQSFSFEFRVQNATTQQYEWFYIKAVPRLEGGEFTGFIGTGININEQKLILSQLEYRKALLEAHNEASIDGNLLVDTKGKILSYNHRFLEIWNIPKQAAENNDDEAALAFAVTQLENPEAFMERVRWMYEHPDEISIDELEFKDGKIIERYGYHVNGADGSYYGCSWMFRDITEQRKYQKAVKESEEKFRLLADSMPQHIWTSDPEGNLNYYNQSVFDYSGLTIEQINKDGWIQIVHPDDRDENIKQWLNAVSSGKDFLFEHRFRRYDGEYRWQLSRAIPQRSANGKIQMWVGTSTDIQEQKELSEALGENLKESNSRMQTILQHAPDAVISMDEDGTIRSWNPEAELIFGWREREVLGKSLTATIIHESFREQHDQGINHYLTTGEGYIINKPIELSAFKKNGRVFPVELKISTSKINGRHIFIVFIRDISIRKEAEETIQNKTNQLIEAQQLAHIGSWEWDVRTNTINWSDELYRIFGLTPNEFKADYDSYLKHIHADDREYVNRMVKKALEDHQPYSFFHRTAGADEKVRIISATGKVFTDGSGKVIRMSGTAQDVTEQKKYEEELKISEERFYKIFDNNPVAMSLSDIKTNKIKYANSRFYNLFGYTKEEVIGRSSEELKLMDTNERKRVMDLIFGYLLENRPLAEVRALSTEEKEELLLKLKQSEKMKDFEILYSRKNGETFPALVSFEIIRIGVDSYTVTSCQDITERKKAEAQLRSQNDQLEKMNKELESFAYISSHDLQEPLRKIQTFTSRITEIEGTNLSDKGKDMFIRVQDSAKRMQNLIQDLLGYSRTTSTERKFEITDLHKIIAEVKEDLKEELKEKHATIEATKLCDADIIPFQFRQLMLNLISNSLKFSKPDNPPHIQISSEIVKGIQLNNKKLSPQDKYCCIKVSDNGIGFEQQYSEKIFEVFQRLHLKNEYNGTGIGLSIVKKIVENHNGIITAKGEPNKGATFEIYIPAT